MLKNRNIRYYTDRRAEIVELLAYAKGLSAESISTLEGARDMATERIQQLTNIRVMGDVIVPLADDRRLESLLCDVIGKHKEKPSKRL